MPSRPREETRVVVLIATEGKDVLGNRLSHSGAIAGSRRQRSWIKVCQTFRSAASGSAARRKTCAQSSECGFGKQIGTRDPTLRQVSEIKPVPMLPGFGKRCAVGGQPGAVGLEYPPRRTRAAVMTQCAVVEAGIQSRTLLCIVQAQRILAGEGFVFGDVDDRVATMSAQDPPENLKVAHPTREFFWLGFAEFFSRKLSTSAKKP